MLDLICSLIILIDRGPNVCVCYICTGEPCTSSLNQANSRSEQKQSKDKLKLNINSTCLNECYFRPPLNCMMTSLKCKRISQNMMVFTGSWQGIKNVTGSSLCVIYYSDGSRSTIWRSTPACDLVVKNLKQDLPVKISTRISHF